ncbi:MAG: isopentenyl-diphosphate Delta-isomerase [Ilumatobacteraceae bacterium]
MTTTADHDASVGARTSPDDLVVLLAPDGAAIGTARKSDVHGADTPLHLAFSCHVVRADGKVLLTRRSAAKRTWPHTWTNACCGHPRPGEAPMDAVHRHLRDELGVEPIALRSLLPDFVYRAEMSNGIVEHEVCPVFVAEIAGEPQLDPDEADAFEWLTWAELIDRARSAPDSLSPWSIDQVEHIERLGSTLLDWVRRPARGASRRVGGHQPAAGADSDDSHNSHDDADHHLDGAVHRTLIDFIEGQQRMLRELAPMADEVAEPIRRLIEAGGKRLRPMFVMWGHRAADGGVDSIDDVVRAAAAVEMLHTFALLHDDVMDRSAIRRSAPTAHVDLADLHRVSGARGDSAWFGMSAAIVAGDMAFVWADSLLEQLECDVAARRRVRSAYDLLRSEVVAGQYLDLRLAGSPATAEQALKVALLKSGRSTVTRPLQIGAALAGGSASTTDALQQYGDPVGVAFQLRDDVLGVFGDPAVTGKGIDDDLCDGKASLLLVRARRLASPAGSALLTRCLGDRTLTAADADRCRDAVAASGALASVEALISSSIEAAAEALDVLVSQDGSEGCVVAAAALARIADQLIVRTN